MDALKSIKMPSDVQDEVDTVKMGQLAIGDIHEVTPALLSKTAHEKLPKELRLIIFDNLHGLEAAGLVSTSKVLYSLGNERLWRNVVLAHPREMDRSEVSIEYFIRTMIARPDHRGLVKTIQITGIATPSFKCGSRRRYCFGKDAITTFSMKAAELKTTVEFIVKLWSSTPWKEVIRYENNGQIQEQRPLGCIYGHCKRDFQGHRTCHFIGMFKAGRNEAWLAIVFDSQSSDSLSKPDSQTATLETFWLSNSDY